MPKLPSTGTAWYGHYFYNKWKNQLNAPKDLQRLMVLRDGKLQNALDPDEGYPSKEKQEALFNAAREKKLFFYPLGSTYPMMYIPDHGTWTSVDPQDIQKLRDSRPKEPAKIEGREPTTAERNNISYYGIRIQSWNNRMAFLESLPEDLTPHLRAHAETLSKEYTLSSQRREAEFLENQRTLIQDLQMTRDQDAKLDAFFAPRPNPTSNLTLPEDILSDLATAPFFDKEIQTIQEHGYDVPQELNFSNRDAATVNLLFAAIPNVTQSSITRPYRDPDYDAFVLHSDFSNLLTSVTTNTRIGINASLIPPAMDAAKHAFEEYQKGDPSILGNAIGEGLRNLNRDFCHMGALNQDAKAPGVLARRILSLLEAHPDLLPSTGLTKAELELSYATVAVTSTIERANRAEYALKRDALGLQLLTQEEKIHHLADIALRDALNEAVDQDLKKWITGHIPHNDPTISTKLQEQTNLYDQTLKQLQDDPSLGFTDKTPKEQQDEAGNRVGLPNCWYDYYATRREPSALLRTLGRPGMLQQLQEKYRNDPGIRKAVKKNVRELHNNSTLKQHTKTKLESLMKRGPVLSDPETILDQSLLCQRCRERGDDAFNQFILGSMNTAAKSAMPGADLRLTGAGKYALEPQEAAEKLKTGALVAQDLKTGTMKTLFFHDNQVQALDPHAFVTQMKASVQDADRRVFFGSRQFKDLSAKLDALAAYKASDPPSHNDRVSISTLARELSDSARNYLTYKKALDPSSPSQGPKTDRRIQLARKLMGFGSALNSAHLEQRTYEEANSVRPVREETPLDTAIRRNYRVAGLPGHTLPDLKEEILRQLQGVNGMLIDTEPMDPQRQTQAKDILAKMIAFQGIRNERLLPGGLGKQMTYNKEAGPLEQLYSKDPEKFLNAIKESDQFYRITQNMGRGNLEDFLLKSPKDQQTFVQNTLQAATTSLNKQPMAPMAGM